MGDEKITQPVVFVVGGPGSGKGTQCANIVKDFGFTHLSSGDLLRAEVASGSEQGAQLQKIMAEGQLVPIETTLGLMKKAMLAEKATSKGYLIDGYPRNVDQGILFEKSVAPCSAVIYFECSDQVMIDRLLDRAKTSGRVDDNEETIKKRLKVFHDSTVPVLAHYKDKAHTISAERAVADIYADVQKVMQGVVGK